MQDIITNLLEIDRKAKTRIDEAKGRRQEILDLLEEEQTQLEAAIATDADKQISTIENDYHTRAQAQIDQLNQRYVQASDTLKQSYESKKEEMVAALVARCTGEAQ